MKTILDIPYYSQQLDVVRAEWKDRSCGVVCCKMVIEYKTGEVVPADDLIDEGLSVGGHGDNGWIHDALVILLRNHGVQAYRQEFRSRDEGFHGVLGAQGAAKIAHSVEGEQPVLVSTIKRWSEEGKYHTVLVVGVEKEGEEIRGFYYHDTDSLEKDGGKALFVPFETFSRHWRRFAIFTE